MALLGIEPNVSSVSAYLMYLSGSIFPGLTQWRRCDLPYLSLTQKASVAALIVAQ
jgi:hypothetical protein